MGMQINIGDHVSTQAGYVAFPAGRREGIMWSRRRANWIAANKPLANPYFQGLPGGRTLTSLLGDNTIWINYAPAMPWFGETEFAGGKEIAISRTSVVRGWWFILATLIHELAHAGGAPGGASHLAEGALVACGLGKASEASTGHDDPSTPYDPTIVGAIVSGEQSGRYA